MTTPTDAQPVAPAGWVLWHMENGWRVTHCPPASYLTDEANKRFKWQCERTEAPYCTQKGRANRRWSGPTPEVALLASLAELRAEYPDIGAAAPQSPAQPQEPAAVQARWLTDEQIDHLWDIYVGEPNDKYPLMPANKRQFARAVLAAAGITQQEPKA